MRKQEFLEKLRTGLYGLPQSDIEERLAFYGEIIEDRMEDGLSEEQAVAEIGSVDEIVSQIVAETPLTKLVKEKIKPKRRLGTGEVVLLVLGAPIWASLLIAAIGILFSLYVSVWSVIVSLWAVFGSLIGCTIGGAAAGILFFFTGEGLAGMATIGVSTVCAGLSILLFFGCKEATRGVGLLTKKAVRNVKYCFVGGEKDDE